MTRGPKDAKGRIEALTSKSKEIADKVAARRDQLEADRRLSLGFVVYRRMQEVETKSLALRVSMGMFIAILPIMVLVFAAVSRLGGFPGDAGHAMVEYLGLTGAAASAFEDLFSNTSQGVLAAGILVAGGLLASGFDIALALQTTYARAWRVERLSGWHAYWRGTVWMAACLALVVSQEFMVALTYRFGAVAYVPVIVFEAGLTFGFWLMTPRLLLDKDLGWRGLLPTAVVGMVVSGALRVASWFVLPSWANYYATPFGAIGAVITLVFWMMIVAYAWVMIAIFGAVWWERHGPPDEVIEIELHVGADTPADAETAV